MSYKFKVMKCIAIENGSHKYDLEGEHSSFKNALEQLKQLAPNHGDHYFACSPHGEEVPIDFKGTDHYIEAIRVKQELEEQVEAAFKYF